MVFLTTFQYLILLYGSAVFALLIVIYRKVEKIIESSNSDLITLTYNSIPPVVSTTNSTTEATSVQEQQKVETEKEKEEEPKEQKEKEKVSLTPILVKTDLDANKKHMAVLFSEFLPLDLGCVIWLLQRLQKKVAERAGTPVAIVGLKDTLEAEYKNETRLKTKLRLCRSSSKDKTISGLLYSLAVSQFDFSFHIVFNSIFFPVMKEGPNKTRQDPAVEESMATIEAQVFGETRDEVEGDHQYYNFPPEDSKDYTELFDRINAVLQPLLKLQNK
jgi:hypothetical protein